MVIFMILFNLTYENLHFQSIIKSKVTANFENVGKKVINSKEVTLEKINKDKIE